MLPGRQIRGRAKSISSGVARSLLSAGMDIWYELAIRELGDLNQEATEILKDAERALLVPPPDEADEEDD